jgi:hypothetical protein
MESGMVAGKAVVIIKKSNPPFLDLLPAGFMLCAYFYI